jgi:hypothetical protein
MATATRPSIVDKQCVYCGSLPMPRERTYRRGTGWFKSQGNRQGTNSAALVAWTDEYACKHCIHKMVTGVSLDQLELFELPYSDD